MRRRGVPNLRRDRKILARLTPDVVARFEAKLVKKGTCRTWTGATDRAGYGQFWIDGRFRAVRAHRIAFLLRDGVPSVERPYVLHKCPRRDRGCVVHTYAGTNRDNTRDRDFDGTTMRGARHYAARLTPAKVRALRARRKKTGESHVKLAKWLNVSAATVRKALDGRSWRGVA